MAQSDATGRTILRSPLGRARGLGAARSGLAHWWAERVTSVALVPLTLWFVAAVLHWSGLPRADMARFVAQPVNATLLLAVVVTTFHHMQLGLQVVIEDYVHAERSKLIGLLAMKAATLLLAIACVIAILKLALSG